MKKISFIVILSLLPFISFAGSSAYVSVTGMVCAFCSQGITKKFKEQKSVKEINVNLDSKLVTIEFQANENLDDAKITEILKDAGYGVSKIERK